MDRNVAQVLAGIRPDVVFNALHGTPGEDGTIQGMLDLMQIPYTHSGLETSVIAIDKELTKMVLVPHGIRMPKGKIVESKTLYEGDPMARPYVLKPVNEGSSVGVAIVTDQGNYGHPISARAEGPWLHFERLLAEPFIQGRELTVAVLGDEALCVTELKPKAGFYDFDAKYTDGLTEQSARPRSRRISPRTCWTWRWPRIGCSAARARRAPTSAGTTSRARPASICSRSTPSPA